MESNNKIKIELRSQAAGISTVIEESRPNLKDISIIKNVSAKTSVSAFPTAKIELNATSKYPNLIAAKSRDEIAIYMKDGNKPYHKFHQGILSSVTIKMTNDKAELTFNSVSAFYLLQKVHLNSTDFRNRQGLREILNEILAYCDIKEKIKVDKKVRNDFNITPFKNFPALSLINAICYNRDLVYDFKNGDVMVISNRQNIIHKLQTSIPIVIDGSQIISSEFEQ